MIRMEIALFLVLSFIAFFYFSAGPKKTALHQTFSVLLIAMLVHLLFDGITVFTVYHLDEVPVMLNDLAHRIFIGSMIFVMYLFYRYIAILVEEETLTPGRLHMAASIYLIMAQIGVWILPIHYAVTENGNYSDGIHANLCYISATFYLVLCAGLFVVNQKKIETKKKAAIGTALLIEIMASLIQSFHPTWLLSGMGLTLMTLSFYLTLENPEILRAELVEQKMSMMYLKSQVNPHFLYNTLDTIRIQAQLNKDQKVADLLMSLVDFFRLSVKVNQPIVELESELELVEAYLDLMCYRYPELLVEWDTDPELENAVVPNFILQPLVENSMLHGLKNKGYKGTVKICTRKLSEKDFEIRIVDSGSGFAPGKKEEIDQMLRFYAKQTPKLEGNSIGLLNVQKRVKLLCGSKYGLSYSENPEGGLTAILRLPLEKEGE